MTTSLTTSPGPRPATAVREPAPRTGRHAAVPAPVVPTATRHVRRVLRSLRARLRRPLPPQQPLVLAGAVAIAVAAGIGTGAAGLSPF